MLTVPAQIFCAPTRAKLMAALRSMPGVCAVLESSELPGITRTPSCFQSWLCLCPSLLICVAPGGAPRSHRSSLLPAFAGVSETSRFFSSAEQRLGLVDAFLLLERGIGVGDNAGPGLHVHDAVLDQGGAQHDAGVHLAGGREIADRTGIDAALFLLQLVDDLHRPHLRRAGDSAGGKAGNERVERIVAL